MAMLKSVLKSIPIVLGFHLCRDLAAICLVTELLVFVASMLWLSAKLSEDKRQLAKADEDEDERHAIRGRLQKKEKVNIIRISRCIQKHSSCVKCGRNNTSEWISCTKC